MSNRAAEYDEQRPCGRCCWPEDCANGCIKGEGDHHATCLCEKCAPAGSQGVADVGLSIEGLSIGTEYRAWEPSANDAAELILADHDAVLVTVTYDDGSQIVFRRIPQSGRGAKP